MKRAASPWLDLERKLRKITAADQALNTISHSHVVEGARKNILISPRIPFRSIISVTTVLSLLVLAGCSSRIASPEARYAPAGDLLDIVKDFQRLAKEDTYRFAIPKDVTGVNIMKATLVRLDDYERKNAGKLTDIIQFNKALALERLREYAEAAVLYRSVSENGGRLGARASKNLEALEAFLNILDKPLPAEDTFQYIKGLDEKVAAWNHLIEKHQGTTYEFLARCEEERIDRAKVAFVEANRYRLKDGNQL